MKLIKPSKKDQAGYNGWWKIIGKKKVQEIQIDVKNVIVENINKIDLDYSMVNYPNIYHNKKPLYKYSYRPTRDKRKY